jgi:hypothetical protein
MTKTLISLSLILLATTAQAQSDPVLPNFDVKAHCAKTLKIVLATPEAQAAADEDIRWMLTRNCIEAETRGRRLLAAEWESYPPSWRRECLANPWGPDVSADFAGPATSAGEVGVCLFDKKKKQH